MTIVGLSRGQGPAVLAEILEDLPAFWGERDLRALHHSMWVHQFSSDALVARTDGRLLGYLFGVITAHELGYVHLIATRVDQRGQGLGRALYATFMAQARARGATRVEAITTPSNHGSIAFHQRLGFTAELVPDYSGPGQSRVLFHADLGTGSPDSAH